MTERCAVMGAGSWGTVLSALLAGNGHPVVLWSRREEIARRIHETGKNPAYLPEIRLPGEVRATSDIRAALNSADTVITAVPSHALRGLLKHMRGHLTDKPHVINATKGLEDPGGMRMSQVIADELSGFYSGITVLSGPSHAEEVIRGIPTTIVASGEDLEYARSARDLFMGRTFRVYTNPDLVGVELGGALKNVIAIAAGISDGLGFGDNTRSALITRGIMEITRLGVSLGARAMTFAGLAGLGDLVVTAGSRHSRNRRLGEKIGDGCTLEEALLEVEMVAEGVKTTRAVHHLAADCNVEMPISTEVYNILYGGKDPQKGVEDLMLRGPKREMEELFS